MKSKVPYVVLDGIDGCGKDLQADMLVEHWKRVAGVDPLRLNEPDDTLPTGKLIRQLLKDGSYPETHAALFMADRMAIHTNKIVPALAAGRPVVSSRSFLTTLVYQQEQWPLKWLRAIHEMLPAKATEIIILDLDPQEALNRIGRRGLATEFYERMDIQKRNRDRYLAFTDRNGETLDRWLDNSMGFAAVVDGSGTPEEVHQRVMEYMQGNWVAEEINGCRG